MEKFRQMTGVAAPLMRANIDTDVVIRIERLINLERGALGPYAFEAWRYLPDGGEAPDFVLNQTAYRQATILIAGRNFGCGSSREGAVWALAAIGIRAVIAPSFGDIFYNNCFQNGVLPIILDEDAVAGLAEQADGRRFSIDLAAQAITDPAGVETSFEVPPLKRQALLQGLDAVAVTLGKEAEIAAFQERDRLRRPWIYAVE